MHHEPGRGGLPGQHLRCPGRAARYGPMDQWGQSGSRAELYDYAGIDVDEIVNAAMLALELNEA